MRRVVVVGAGIVGLFVAWYARAAGHEVLVLEGGDAARDCCSLGNAGLVVPSHVVPLAAPGAIGLALRSLLDRRSPLRLRPRLDHSLVAWCWRFWRAATRAHVERSAPALRDIANLSRRSYEELARLWGDVFALRKQGLRILCRTSHGFDEEVAVARFAESLGMPAEVLDAGATARAEPQLETSAVGSVFYPLDAHLMPQVLVPHLVEQLTSSGARVLWSTPATGWRTASGEVRAVTTPRGEVRGDEFVLAAGVWSEKLARMIGLRLPLQAGKGYSLTIEHPYASPVASLILSEARVAVTPMGGRLRFAGTLELSGQDPGVNQARLAAMLDSVPRYLPGFDATQLSGGRPWAGLRPCSPDGLPYLGRTRRFANLSICTGHAMMGVSLAPASGQLLSEVIDRRPTTMPLAAFDPDRFT